MGFSLSHYLSDRELIGKALEGLDKGYSVAIAFIVEKHGSGPRSVGAKIVVYENGEVYGSLGGGSFERDVVEKALDAIRDGRPRLLRYSFTGSRVEGAIDTGLVCGGVLSVYIDVLKPSVNVYIVGAGRIGKPLADILYMLGFSIYILDTVPELLTRDRFPYARELYSGSPEELGDYIASNARKCDLAYIVHGETSVDYTVLKKLVLESSIGYIGLLGSKRKVLEFIRRLKSEGVSVDVIREKLHAPIGIDIAADTPEEIAVSIAAEAIAWVKKRYSREYRLLDIVGELV